MRLAMAALVLVSVPGAASAQVEARTVTAGEASSIKSGKPAAQADQLMKSPMLLEIPLRSDSGLPVPVWIERTKTHRWSSGQARRFVCDRARVSLVSFSHGKPKKDFVAIDLSVWLTSEWYRQDLDVTLSILALDGKEITRKLWKEETVGAGNAPFAGHAKELHLETKVSRAEWDRWVSNEGAPLVRILVEIEGEPAQE